MHGEQPGLLGHAGGGRILWRRGSAGRAHRRAAVCAAGPEGRHHPGQLPMLLVAVPSVADNSHFRAVGLCNMTLFPALVASAAMNSIWALLL